MPPREALIQALRHRAEHDGVTITPDSKVVSAEPGGSLTTEALRTPLDVDVWSRSFPVLRETLETFSAAGGPQHAYPIVTVSAWSRGRVALVGDSATGLPPTLGQGPGWPW